MIRENNSRYPVSKMCLSMEVSRSGYYAFVNRPESVRSKRHKELAQKIKKIHEESFRIYGSPNITIALNREGIAVSRGIVARLMRKNGIKSKIRKKYKATTNTWCATYLI